VFIVIDGLDEAPALARTGILELLRLVDQLLFSLECNSAFEDDQKPGMMPILYVGKVY
jgi:hypothetical protein